MEIEQITEESLKGLHVKYGYVPNLRESRCFELIWNHSIFVGRIALQLVGKYQEKTGIALDRELIKKGALVYKIGAYKAIAWNRDYSDIDSIGCKILYQEGLPLKLVTFPLAFSSPNYRRDILQRLQVPADENSVPNLEELLIGYADHFHDGSIANPRFVRRSEAHSRMKVAGRLSRERFEILEDTFGEPDLTNLEEKYQGWHGEIKKHYIKLGLDQLVSDK